MKKVDPELILKFGSLSSMRIFLKKKLSVSIKLNNCSIELNDFEKIEKKYSKSYI